LYKQRRLRVIDVIRLNREVIETLVKARVTPNLLKYCPMYDDYEAMISEGLKITYIISVIAEKYGLNEASVYKIIKRYKTRTN
jgi:hypothetical protein